MFILFFLFMLIATEVLVLDTFKMLCTYVSDVFIVMEWTFE